MMQENNVPMEKRLKIAVLVRRFITTGGMERYCVEVTRRLAQRHEVHVFAQDWEWNGPEKIIFHRVPCRIRKPNYINQILFSRFVKRLANDSFDIIHSHERVTLFDALTVHCPCFRTYIQEERSLIRRFGIWLSIALSPRKFAYILLEKKQFSMKKGRMLIAVSRKMQKNVQSCYSIPDNYFGIAFPGVNEEFFVEDHENRIRESSRADLGINKHETVLLFVGNEFERKGLDALLKGFSLVAGSNVRLLIAGKGEKKKKYARMAKSLGIEEKVVFLGLVKDIKSIYFSSDIFILPTISEPAGMAPMEAMAAGLPVIVSSRHYSGCAEHINEKQAVILEKPEDPHEIANAILDLMDKEKRKTTGEAGRALAAQFTWDRTTEETINVYNRIIEERSIEVS